MRVYVCMCARIRACITHCSEAFDATELAPYHWSVIVESTQKTGKMVTM